MRVMSRTQFFVAVAGALILSIPGCKTLPLNGTEAEAVGKLDPRLEVVKVLLERERYTEAMLRCIDVARVDPDLKGLAQLQSEVTEAITARQGQINALRQSSSRQRAVNDVNRSMTIPDTWQSVRMIKGEHGSLRTPTTDMQRALEKRVTVRLDQPVSLTDFVREISRSENINMIVDGSIDTGAEVQIDVADTPLSELLDYAARNFDVAFYLGQNVIWVTPRDASESATPMETRVYRLRRGISGDEVLAEGEINILEAVNRFVPAAEGSDILFDDKAHVLIVRNTRENLRRVEDIVEALDVSPPQVLIEARFISTSIDDLRELGIDWILDSPMAVTTKQVIRDGAVVDATRSQIDRGKLLTPGVSSEGEQIGLNFTYRGLLTDPMFQAVVHALEQSGGARTLSAPRITTVNNRVAKVRIGKDYRYHEEFDVREVRNGTDSNGNATYTSDLVPVGKPTLEETGIELEVIASVGADMETITLMLMPEISQVADEQLFSIAQEGGSAAISGGAVSTNGNAAVSVSQISLPIFERSKIETEVVVRSGETVVLGGLSVGREFRRKSGVPILQSLPFIGFLFRSERIEEEKENLLVFVTATIISTRGESMLPMLEEMPLGPQAGLTPEGTE